MRVDIFAHAKHFFTDYPHQEQHFTGIIAHLFALGCWLALIRLVLINLSFVEKFNVVFT